MRYAGLTTLLPLPCLLLIAVVVRVWNIRHERVPPSNLVAPVVSVTTDDRATARLQQELKTVLLRYRTLKGAEQEHATYVPAWKRWQNPPYREVINQRLIELRSWSDFSVESIEQRSSGFVTVMLACDGEHLKAWLVPEPGGWKLAGIVRPFNLAVAY